MTNIELPSAAEALAMAYAIVKSPCSAAETERATLLFEIGRELRIAADMRAINARRAALDEARNFAARAQLGLRPSSYEPQVVTPVTMHVPPAAETAYVDDAVAEATQYMPIVDEPTTQFRIVWSPGDKADCAHCHTPIVYEARRMVDPVLDGEDDPQFVWLHKYTDRRPCVAPVLDQQTDDEVPAGTTFAEPSR